MRVEERLLKYVKYYTTSDENSGTHPSTSRQLKLAEALKSELESIGASDTFLSDTGYVYGRIPASKGCEDIRTIALISHMDTAPDFSGENVNPQIITDYDGGDVTLGQSGLMLKSSEFPDLKDLKHKTLITTDGTTLLGADDKAGVAEIMTAAAELISSDTPHGEIWICFTPDEEIGEGPDDFDLNRVKAAFGFTVDGDGPEEISFRNFNAAGAKITIHGKSVHPGSAKGLMINAADIAAQIAASLPESETPSTTEGLEGFYHLTGISGNVSDAALEYILRDFDSDGLKKRKEKLTQLIDEINRKYSSGTAEIEIKDQYSNMYEIMKDHQDVIELAKEAIQSAGITPVDTPIRGGTDGAQLSFKGLPCPNLGTGGHAFHGPYEHIAVEDMQKMVQIIRYICTHVK